MILVIANSSFFNVFRFKEMGMSMINPDAPKGSFEITEHSGIDPEAESPRFIAKHLSAYHFARPYAKGRVLEVGFGDGYGASFLAAAAQEVKAIDLFDRNVNVASAKYPKPNLRFIQMNATALQWEDRYFDLTVSFQVIEHIPEALLSSFIREISRVTRAGGTACLSTLNLKKNQKPGKSYQKSPHHDKEFTPQEFQDLLAPFFREVVIYGLYPSLKHGLFERLKKAGVFNFLPEAMDPVKRFYQKIGVRDFQWLKKSAIDECIDLMALCRL